MKPLDILWFIPVTTFTATAAYMGMHDIDGWGWFIFAALL